MEELLERLYKAANHHHFEIQKHFDNQDLSDEQYFILGLSDDIMVNTVNILINLDIGNIESLGIDNSCRAIIEAISLLNMYKEGGINDTQVKLYRYQYAMVDKSNLGKIIKLAGLGKDLFDRRINEDKEKAISLFAELFGVSIQDTKRMLEDGRHYFGDPLSFLMNSPDDLIRMSSIVHKYNPHGDSINKLYSFFSIFDHPRYENDLGFEKIIQEYRLKNVYILLKCVIDYFNANRLFLEDDKSLNTIQKELFETEKLKDLKSNILAIQVIFTNLKEQFGIFEDGTDNMTLFFLTKMECIAINMLVTISTGYNEQTISVFRPFMELNATFNFINSANDQEEMMHLMKGFWFSSALQLDLWRGKVENKNYAELHREALNTIYEEYYKNKYHLSSFDQFYEGMKKNSLYWFDKNIKGYKKLVNNSVDLFTNNNLSKEDYLTAYRISIDVAHASGYSFNASPIVVESYALRCTVLFWNYILEYTLLNSLELVRHKKDIDIKNTVILINEFIRYYSEEQNKLTD